MSDESAAGQRAVLTAERDRVTSELESMGKIGTLSATVSKNELSGDGLLQIQHIRAMIASADGAFPEALLTDLDNAAFTREVGRSATLAVQAFGDGDYARAVTLLRPVRSGANRFGGSHAQRDLIDLTLLEAAARSGDAPLAAALAAERLALKPRSPLAQRLAGRFRVL